MAARAISQTIKLEGAEEIQRLLAGIGNIGEKAMAQIAAATGEATKKLEAVSNAVAGVEKSFASVGGAAQQFSGAVSNLGGSFNNFQSALQNTITRTTLLVGAITGAGAAIAAFVVKGIKAVDDLDEQAQALGLTAQKYQELAFAAGESGVKTGQFSSAIRRLSQEIEQESARQSKALLGFIDNARKGFDDMGGRIKIIGDQIPNTFKFIADATGALQEKLKGTNTPLIAIRQEVERLVRAKDWETLGALLSGTGVKLPGSGNSVVDTLRRQAEGAKDAIRQLGVEFKKAENGQVDLYDVIGQIADKFQELPDGVNKTALSMDLFGKAAGPAMVPFLNQGRAGIEALLAKMRELGVGLSKDQIAAANSAARAYDIFARSVENAKNSVATAFAPLTTAVAGGLTEFIAKNKASIDAFATSINQKALPYVKAFFDLISGRENNSAEADRLRQLAQTATSVGQAFQQAATVIGQAFTVILGFLDQVATLINQTFGTNLSGGALAFIIVLTQLVGGFALLASGLRLVVGFFGAFQAGLLLAGTAITLLFNTVRALIVTLAAMGPTGWIILGIIALAAAIGLLIYNWDAVTAAVKRAWAAFREWLGVRPEEDIFDWIGRKFDEQWQKIKKKALEKIDFRESDDVWTWLERQFDKVVEKIKQKAIELAEFLKRTLTQSPEVAPSPTDPTAGTTQGVPLLGGQSPFDRLPQSQNIEDRRGETSGQLQQLEQEGRAMLERLAQFAQQVGEQVTAALNTMVTAASQSAGQFAQAFTGAGDLIGQLLASSIQRAADGINQIIGGIGQAVQAALDSLVSAIAAVAAQVDSMIASVIAALEAAVARAQALAQAAREAAAAAAAAGGGGGGFASGGYTGAGGKYQPAGIVHRGEYVQPARVVSQPGVLAFMEILRRSGDLQGTIARFARGFADGGFVNSLRDGLTAFPMPGFATGGFVPAAPNMPHLGTVDLSLGNGVVARVGVDQSAVDQFRRAGIHRQLVRAGKIVR
jgi:phage-related protein